MRVVAGKLIDLSFVVKNISLQDNTNGDYMVQCLITFPSCIELSSIISISVISLVKQLPRAKDDISIPNQNKMKSKFFFP